MLFNSKKLYFKALSLSLASMISISSAANATSFESTNNKMLSVSNVETGKLEKLKEWSKKNWILTGSLVNTAIGASVLTSLIGLKTAGYKSNTLAVTAMQRGDFHTQPNRYTKKQEGIAWCWLACLQGMYKYHGIEISQEDIFKKICKVAPAYFEVMRTTGVSTGGVMPKSFVSSVNSIDSTLKYNKAIIHVLTRESRESCMADILGNSSIVKRAILDYYNSIGQAPFVILDNYVGTLSSGSRYLAHAVNVMNIDSERNEITIEDPATGLSRVEKLNDFVFRYYESGMLYKIPMIEMFSVAPSNLDLPVETHYFINDRGCTKQSCLTILNV